MRTHIRTDLSAVSVVVAGLMGLAAAAAAQPVEQLNPINVTASRLGSGIAGTSTSIITAQDIERSPAQSLPDVLSREPGIQLQSLFGGIGGARDIVDMRGFGATATSNTLVLVNGRRLNDADIAGVDFAAIPLNSIERIEITRGNSGAVLYGDGAVGGTINIVTKKGVGLPSSLRVDGAAGSYGYRDGRFSATHSIGPVATAAFGNAIYTDGYRVNNSLRQKSGVGDLRYVGDQGTAYFNITADDQFVGLPGGRRVTPTSNLFLTDPRGAATPFDHAQKQGLSATAGLTRMLAPGTEMIVDASMRRKIQQAAFFSAFGPDFDSHVDSSLTTGSVTPRITSEHRLFGLGANAIVGLDLYETTFASDRAVHRGDPSNHRYDIGQRTLGLYGQETVALGGETDLALGGRLQRNMVSARDRLDPAAPGGLFAPPQGTPLDFAETRRAWHVGLEHRLGDGLAVFARTAHSFRLPNADERVGQGPFGVPTSFDLKTQTSQDYEAGIRIRVAGLTLQSSAYRMDLKDELYFSPASFTNVNLDPTRRYGVENAATLQLSDTVRVKAGVAYTRAVFRQGPFAGNDVPLVSRWSGSTGIDWDLVPRWLSLGGVVRYAGQRRMDNDAANVQPLIPANTVVDMRLGGEIEQPGWMKQLHWSVAVLNLFGARYFNYAIASAFDLGVYNAYPQPGRTVVVRLSGTF